MPESASTKSVLETILEWSAARPRWQQDALRRIVSTGTPDEASIVEIVQLCKKEHGADGVVLDAQPLDTAHLPANPSAGASITITSLAKVAGVNQLASDQTLAFEPNGLTVIYGPNGAGKSGYGRVLKRACRARKSGSIMPDAYNPDAPKSASATFETFCNGSAEAPIEWQDADQPHPVLSAISVFDKDCASVHIQGKNEVAFRPFGLDVPDDLAGVCVKVKERLTAEQTQLNARRDPCFAQPTWTSSTSVGKFMAGITATTDIAELEVLAEVSQADHVRHGQLTQDLARNPVEAAAEQRLIADGVSQLKTFCENLATTFSNDALSTLKGQADGARTLRQAANLAAQEAFGDMSVKGVGREPWRALWDAARTFAGSAAGQAFPPEEGDPCLLCLQPISADAKERLASFEQFVRNDIETKATIAEREFSNSLKEFQGKKIDTRIVQAAIDRIAISNPDLAKRTADFILSAEARSAACLDALKADDPLIIPGFAISPVAKLTQLEADTREYAKQLDQAADVEGRNTLIAELVELTDRMAGKGLLPKVVAEIARLKELSILSKAIGETSTTAITKLGNEIADNVITPKMRDRFQSEIVRLAADKVRVEVVRSGGQFGSPQYQVRLFANQNAKVHEVLSEGEQTCVALAAFLAELATASHQSGLVFDDPVTSLDHRWRRRVAERLVAEAAHRQIVVFTHDLVFVNDLNDLAYRDGVNAKLQSLSRGSAGTGIVSDGLPWQHAKVEARIDLLEKAAAAAKRLYDANDEDGYRNEASRVYNLLRATWERCLEDIVFAGVIHRHRDYLDTKNLKKVVVLEEADVTTFRDAFKKCSDLIDAHDPSRARDGEVPPPADVSSDITTLKNWVTSLRDRQKQVA